MDFLILVVVIILVVAIGSISGAIFLINRNRKDRATKEEIREQATIIRTDSHTREVTSGGAGTVDSVNSYLKTDYFAEFKMMNGERLRFKINKKVFLTLHDNETGFLSYRGKRFIGFEKDDRARGAFIDPSEFFRYTKKVGPTLSFYCEAPSRNFTIPSNYPIQCDVRESWKYLSEVCQDNQESFCVIQNDGTSLEIICAKKPNRFELYLTDENQSRLGFECTDEFIVEGILKAYYDKQDVRNIVNWKAE